jgi:hypothetical protein
VWVVAVALLGVSVAVFLLESLDEQVAGVSTEENRRMEQAVEAIVPNYYKIWWARNLLWHEGDQRGKLDATLNPFGRAIIEKHSSRAGSSWTVRSWSEVCDKDSDGDGLTNGQELGDPCCIWQGKNGPDVAWSWDLTHPGAQKDFLLSRFPSDAIVRLLKNTDCAEVKKLGRYPSHTLEFEKFFYAVHRNGADHDWMTEFISRFSFLAVYMGVVCWWTYEKELWREMACFFSCSRCRATSSTLSLGTGVFLFVIGYLHNDLSSAFVHSFFDHCGHKHPLVGGQCRGTQYHHFKPRAQSLEPLVSVIGNPIAILPASFVVVLYGFLGSGVRHPKWLRTGYQYPRWFEFLLLSLALSAPLTYYFHQAAHTPPEELGFCLTWLQRMGLALSPEFHKVHHRRPNGTCVGRLDGFCAERPRVV